MSTSQMVLNFVCPKYEALPCYVSPRVGPRELYRLEIALKIIITVPNIIPIIAQPLSIDINYISSVYDLPRSLSFNPKWLSNSVQTFDTRDRYSSFSNSSITSKKKLKTLKNVALTFVLFWIR